MSQKRGFTLIEVVVVMTLGSILLSIMINSMGTVQSQFSVRSARDTYISFHARTRAYAIERGTVTRFTTDPRDDVIYVHTQSDTIDRLDLREAYGVDVVTAATSDLRLCFNPRGMGEESCNSFNTVVSVRFIQNADTSSVQMLPLGQLNY